MSNTTEILQQAGLKPTPNRILVLRELLNSHSPLSLAELDMQIDSLDKSSVFRTLTQLLAHHIIHPIEDGRGIVKYEVCNGKDGCSVNDMHVHFYCESCHKVYCFEDIPTPIVSLPDGFNITTINYMLKGICPQCHMKMEQ